MTTYTAVVSGKASITARGPIREAAERMLGRLWIDQIPVRLASEDPALFPSAARAGQDGRQLCWPGQPGPSRALLDRIAELRAAAEADGLTEVALLGRGAPARAAELVFRHFAALHAEAEAEAAAGRAAPSEDGDADAGGGEGGADGTGTDEVGADGIDADGTGTDGTGADGTGADGIEVPPGAAAAVGAFETASWPAGPPRGPGGMSLTVLDGLEPGPLLRVAGDRERLRRTLVVVAGNDQATDTLRRVFVQLFQDLDLAPEEIARRFVVVTAPGGVPAKKAADAGHPLIEAPEPTAFGALSPYALVPAGLAGADVAALLDGAARVLPSLTRPENNPGLVLGAILGGAVRSGRETMVLGGYPADLAGSADSAAPGTADWIAPLLAEATGGRLLPVVQHGGLPVVPDDDLFLVTLEGRPRQDDATVSGPLAAQLVLWEYAAAVAAHLLDIDPLRAPERDPAEAAPDPVMFAEGDPGQAVEVHTADPAFAAAADLAGLLDAVVRRAASDGHLAIVAHLDPDPERGQGAQVRRLAAVLAARCARPVTISWGHRYPAIGNDHREKGVYLVVTGNVVHDVPVPGRHQRLGPLQVARALGEARAAARGGRPVVRLHLRDRWAGLARLLESARGGR
ncbi:glucose-6-phosphate isomerase [Spirillospora sp. NPDC029432]|uniref:glucose-6-phosphate isomerase n=1 Tax=Spirillospora sp. NPDC029432 TaxID=3154599 RepID=UPI003452252C